MKLGKVNGVDNPIFKLVSNHYNGHVNNNNKNITNMHALV